MASASPVRAYLTIGRRTRAQSRSEREAATLAYRTETRYVQLLGSRPHLDSRTLRMHVNLSILQGLALCLTLLEERCDRQVAVEESGALFEAASGRLFRLLAFSGRQPGSSSLFRLLARIALQRPYPRQGWDSETIEDSEQSFAFNMPSCLYMDVLTTHVVAELMPVFCRMDELRNEGLPEAIAWDRAQAFGESGGCCDLRWLLREGLSEGGSQ